MSSGVGLWFMALAPRARRKGTWKVKLGKKAHFIDTVGDPFL
jgi:hypothetical protein